VGCGVGLAVGDGGGVGSGKAVMVTLPPSTEPLNLRVSAASYETV